MKRYILSILASGIFAGAFAIPAKQGMINFQQPDGSIIKVMLAGDEHGHMLYSAEGHLLIEKDGILEYAEFDSDGVPFASGHLVKTSLPDISLISRLQSQKQIDAWAEKLSLHKASRLSLLGKGSANGRKYVSTLDDDSEEEGGSEEDGENENPNEEENQPSDDRLVPLNFGRFDTNFPVIGEQKGLVILVEYQDVEFKYGDHDYFSRLLNEEGFSDNESLGSARDWFIENSNGLFIPEFDVYGPVMLPENRLYYGGNDKYGNDRNPEQMAIHALELLDEEVDFSQYDRDGDGVIDNVFIFYAGKGEHDSGISNAVWPHSWEIPYDGEDAHIFDGVYLNHYACTCEYPSGYKRPDGIGTFVHEFSHVMGLPDLYATSYTTSFTPGRWSVLDTGPYNNNGLTPPNYSAFEKCALGWLDFIPLAEGDVELPYLADSNVAYVLPADKNEFFFFENRQQIGNDQFIPGHGMLVWHVDYKKSVWDMNTINNKPTHQYVDLVEADNTKTESSRKGDAFPGTKGITSFGFTTKPQLANWAKEQLAYDIENIEESEDGLITFKVVQSKSEIDPGAVETITTDGVEMTGCYDLMGRKVDNPGKGIYIINGKKVVRK